MADAKKPYSFSEDTGAQSQIFGLLRGMQELQKSRPLMAQAYAESVKEAMSPLTGRGGDFSRIYAGTPDPLQKMTDASSAAQQTFQNNKYMQALLKQRQKEQAKEEKNQLEWQKFMKAMIAQKEEPTAPASQLPLAANVNDITTSYGQINPSLAYLENIIGQGEPTRYETEPVIAPSWASLIRNNIRK